MKFESPVYCLKGGDQFPEHGFKTDVNQKQCEEFCAENANCRGYHFQRDEEECIGPCHLRPDVPPKDKSSGDMMCRFGKNQDGYQFYERPESNNVRK